MNRWKTICTAAESLKESVGQVCKLDVLKNRLKGSHIKDAKEVQMVSKCVAMATCGRVRDYTRSV
jgi:hypothetical protein